MIETGRFLLEARAVIRGLAPQIVAAWKSDAKRPHTKGDGSFVTDTDHLVERELVACMQRVAPGVPVVAEEEVSGRSHTSTPTPGEYYAMSLQHENLIVVDPIDGTKNFVEGSPYFCVAVGVTARVGDGHWPIAGIVAVPAHDVMFWSDGTQVMRESLSSGATEAIKRQSATSKIIFANSHEKRWLEQTQRSLCGERRSYSASVYDILATALGENHAALLGSQRVWDVIAPLSLALPLGLSVNDAETGEVISSLCATDFSPDIEKRPWRLTRKMVLVPQGVSVADVVGIPVSNKLS